MFGIYSTFLTIVTLSLLAFKVLVLIDVARREQQAFPAADRQTKGRWLLFTGGAVLGHLVQFDPTGILNIAGTIAAIVYWVDVRPRIQSLYRNRW